MYSRSLLIDILEWDVRTWRRAIVFWDRFVRDASGARVLDVGARRGGLSLYFALKGADVVCSDLHGPPPEAAALHRRYGVADRVTYADTDATAIAMPDASFDIVCFKSVLGGIGRGGNLVLQQQAVREMHRVLKPGGLLLFAENLQASALHRWLRRAFVSWGAAWRYLRPEEIDEMLGLFREKHLGYAGFLATLGRREWQRSLLHGLDLVLEPLIPVRSRYLVYGCARK